MAETSVKNKTCRHCDADIRPDTDFCYNCGGELAADNLDDAPPAVQSSNGKSSNETTKLKLAEPADAPVVEPAIEEATKLKSAASMRRQSKIYQPKRIEVSWEEHKNAPNVWFILAALILTLFVAAVFYLAIYLK